MLLAASASCRLSSLKALDLNKTAVTGDIREISKHDFLELEEIVLPSGACGGTGYEFQRISDAPDVINSLYSIKKQRPKLLNNWYGKLSADYPDRYDGIYDEPPFFIAFVQAGSRVGYRWENDSDIPCEVNWLDPEPDRESSDYEKYTEKLNLFERQARVYRGFHQPPTEEEYRRLGAERNLY